MKKEICVTRVICGLLLEQAYGKRAGADTDENDGVGGRIVNLPWEQFALSRIRNPTAKQTLFTEQTYGAQAARQNG